MNNSNKKWNTRKPVSIGLVALIVLIAGIGIWSVKVNIAGAIVASGIIEVEENRQVVQHPDGGVIGEILVDDGDTVAVGEVLLRFDDTLLQSDLAIVRGQLYEVLARKSRLRSERDGIDELVFDEELLAAQDKALVAELMQGQRDLFSARIDSRAREASLLRERIAQIEEQLTGSVVQMSSLERQLQLISDELEDEKDLLAKGLSQATKVRALQREFARIEGSIGSLTADIAQNRGKIAEIEIEILRLNSSLREEAITTLRDLQYNEIKLREEMSAITETLSRMAVVAPASGVIYGRQFNAVRSVVQAAEPILYIVPQDSALVISSRIPAIHIDQIYIGQTASLRFSAFDMRTTPEIPGKVTKISPDVFVDENTGITFYSVEILPDEYSIKELGEVEIIPGMPVEVFLKTTDRTPLDYLIKPLGTYFNRAFREN